MKNKAIPIIKDIREIKNLFFQKLFTSLSISDNRQYRKQQDHTDCQRKNYILCESGYEVSNDTAAADSEGIWELCGYMVNVVTLRTGGCHDRRVGDRGHMVATYRSGEGGCDADN